MYLSDHPFFEGQGSLIYFAFPGPSKMLIKRNRMDTLLFNSS